MPIAIPVSQPPGLASPASAGAMALLVAEMTIPGCPEHVQLARALTGLALRAGSLDDDGVSELLATELVTNAITHSDSGLPGGLVTISIAVTGRTVLVEVTDNGGRGAPVLRPAGADDGAAEDGRGLHLLERLADQWGYLGQGHRATTWFELTAGQPA